jgi:SAM-dependent methyltransferase
MAFQPDEPGAGSVSSVQMDYVGGDRIEGQGPSGLVASNYVRLDYDGRPWATIPVSPQEPGTPQIARFSSGLPPIAAPGRSHVKAFDAGSGRLLAELSNIDRQPTANGHGLLAHDVLMVHDKPFLAVPWMQFDGAVLTISGAHLPPAGDPSSLGVSFAPGVSYSFECSLPSKEFGSHFWYWPNAHLSTFVVKIDLPASSPGCDPFSFDFTYPRASPLPEASATELRPASLAGRVWVPQNLSSFVGFPRDSSQLTRVQAWSNDRTVTLTGFNAFRTIEALLNRHGSVPYKGMRLLDWGCGHGRVARHFIANWPEVDVIGTDIDAENIAWCRENLHGGTFEVTPLWPPSPIAADSIDAVFGISVMTHLTADAQAAWLDELHRLLKAQGLALITFAGPGAAAWSSVFREPTWWQRWSQTGFSDETIDHALDGKISDRSYYRSTVQTPQHVRSHWQRGFELVEIYPDLLGNLDVAVMRRR